MAFYSDQLAEEYVEKRKGYQATDKEVFSYIDQISLEGKKVLDFGCGDGVHDQGPVANHPHPLTNNPPQKML